MISIQFSPI